MDKLVIVRGGGDIATGIIQRLYRCGYKILILETSKPTAIRRTVCLSEAVFSKETTVEDMTSKIIYSLEEMDSVFLENKIPVFVDEKGDCIKKLKPHAVVDGILAKKNLGTTIDMAPIVIGVGPGFEAGVDCHIVIETMRGHNLGRLIFSGFAKANTGSPGSIMGYTDERVIKAIESGIFYSHKKIGDEVKKSENIGNIDNINIVASIDGIIRGLIRDGFQVHKGMKIGDIDPRIDEKNNCYTISDKARAIGGSVLEGIIKKERLKK